MPDNSVWDMQLRRIAARWWELVLRISSLSRAEIIRATGYRPSTFHRLERLELTPRGKLMAAIAKATGIDEPKLVDQQNYAELAARSISESHEAAAASTVAVRVRGRAEKKRPREAGKKPAQGGRGKG